MRRFRFKTLEEFGGQIPSNWNREFMIPFLGIELQNFAQCDIEKKYGRNEIFSYKDSDISSLSWNFRGTDLVEILEKDKEQINMERIHKEDWHKYDITIDIFGVELQSGSKYYLLPNVDGYIPVNLVKHENTEYIIEPDLEESFTQSAYLKENKKLFKFNSMQDMIAWATS